MNGEFDEGSAPAPKHRMNTSLVEVGEARMSRSVHGACAHPTYSGNIRRHPITCTIRASVANNFAGSAQLLTYRSKLIDEFFILQLRNKR